MKVYKNLYINGCSFTAGHELDSDHTWPVVLAKELGLELHQDARNGNSMESIFHLTVNNLPKFSSEDTLVIVGLTWKERYSIPYWKGIFNITPSDLGTNKQVFLEKTSTTRRISSALSTEHTDLDNIKNEIVSESENFDKFNTVLRKYVEYYEALLENDINLNFNQGLFYFNYVYTLEKIIKAGNYDYLFIDFPVYFSKKFSIGEFSNILSYNSVDKNFVVPMGWDIIGSNPDQTSHPNIEQSKVIANLIKNRL